MGGEARLAVIGIPDHESEETLQSLCSRIEQVYRVVAHEIVSGAFQMEREALEKANPSMNPQLNKEGMALSTLPAISISALEEFVLDQRSSNRSQRSCGNWPRLTET